MKKLPTALAVLVVLTTVSAQEVAAAAQGPALPAANSAEATALLDQACSKMLALGRGTFRSDEEQDNAIMRGQNLPIGGDEGTSLRGGWLGELRWAETDDDTFALQNGRLVTKTEAGWKLRNSTLASGAAAPFVLSPNLLFAMLQQLPAEQKKVTHVEAGDIGGKPVAILTLSLDGEAATDLALSGALPPVAGGMMFRIGGMFGGAPEKTYTVDLALFVDPGNGDVLRLRSKTYEDNPMLANVRLQIAHDDGGGEVEEKVGAGETDASSDKAAAAKVAIKKGLPDRKPGKTESVSYLKVDFKDLGTANAIEIDAGGKRWLGRQ